MTMTMTTMPIDVDADMLAHLSSYASVPCVPTEPATFKDMLAADTYSLGLGGGDRGFGRESRACAARGYCACATESRFEGN
jgi:hypothetical protein